jgi:predicted  nucleic acid-binding Zn-ribbon protein
MAERESAPFTVTPASVSGVAVIFLVLAALLGFLNTQKVKALRANATSVQSSAGGQRQAETKVLMGGTSTAKADEKAMEAEERATKAEAGLAQVEKEKADLQGKLDASQQEIAALRERAAGANGSVPDSTAAPAQIAQSADLQSQLDDVRRQLDGAEKEKAVLAEKLQEAQEHPAQVREAPKTESKKRRETTSTQRENIGSRRAGVHGTVLAYNQAYNFVVLNLGARNGVEPNSEMLVLRDGTLIGKIRVSSVEPATAIGDIMTNSLARGVQVQPGDSVIYAGTSP